MYFKEMNVIVVLVIICLVGGGDRKIQVVEGEEAHRILLDTDVDTDDFFALLYLLKLNRSQIHLQGITISANAWLDAGHAVNQIYDILYMMGRDDIAVGVGGEGGILDDGTILSDVGGYLPLIEQGIGTAGHCRYRQAIPVGIGGRLDLDTNFGFRKSFLPQGKRKYTPLRQPTAQQVMVNIISTGPTNVFLTGSDTNFGIFLMKNPQLKKNVKHVYIMGGGLNSKNPTGCCPKNETFSCQPRQCGDPGNLFSDYTSNPYAEFNMFCDPFAAYQVIHSGIPITLVPLDATNTIPITPDFFKDFEKNQHTFEAQYCFKSLKMVRDTWFDEHFYTSYFMWDSFMSGVAISIMLNPCSLKGENEFAEMEYMNITVITSNEPYGVSDGSNPFFDKLRVPKFNLTNRCVHSGHVQTSLRDPFCQAKNGKGICQDGYTKEVIGQDGVPVLVAVRAKPNIDTKSSLNRDFFSSFLKFINLPNQAGRFNVTTQFPYYKEVFYKPDFTGKNFGKNVVFDMDMSAGDFVSLFYLLKLPSDIINLLAVVITPTGWANAATIDVVYDVLHMMGRDDIPVGLGDVFAMNESDPIFPLVGGCKYNRAIPHGSGGFLDSDTLYGLARDLPRSPRRYTAENLMKYGAPRDTENPNLRQQLAMEVWESVVKRVGPESKVSILTNGPLTTLATIITSGENLTSCIEDILIVGGHINYNNKSEKGNVINIPSNEYAEMNMFLDPLAANTVFSSEFNITLLPLNIQRSVSHFKTILMKLDSTNKTPEAMFTRRLLSRLNRLKLKHFRYHHMDTFLGEILGGVILGGDHTILKPTFEEKRIKISTTGTESEDGTMTVDEKEGKPVKLLTSLNTEAYFNLFAFQLNSKNQSAVVGSFKYQTRLWSVHST